MVSRIALRRFVATLALFSGVLCCPNTALAQEHPPATEPAKKPKAESEKAPPAASATIGIPDEPTEVNFDAAIAAFVKVRGWLDSQLMPEINGEESKVHLPGARGVAVILRNDGRVIGIGTEWPGGGSGDDRMLRRAFGRAVGSALGDRVMGALPRELRDAATKQLALEIDFAARPEPLLGRTFAECVTRLDPGVDGIALRRGRAEKSQWAASYPSIQYATNSASSPDRVIPALLQDLEFPLKDLPDLVRVDPVGIFHFSSLRLAQATAEEPPFVRGRGAPRVADGDVTEASTRAFALATLDRLEHSLEFVFGNVQGPDGIQAAPNAPKAAGNLGILGNYNPVNDEYKPFVAPPAEQALVAWAAASVAASEHFDATDRARAREFAIRLIDELGARMPGEDSPSAGVPAMAFLLCAIARLGGEEGIAIGSRDLAETVRQKLVDPLESGNASDRPLAALAAAMALGSEHHVAGVTETRAGLDSAWASAAPPDLVGQLPWLVLGEAALARNGGGPVAHTDIAMKVARLLNAAQAGFGAVAAEFDVRGGYRLTGKTRGGVTSQSLRPGLGIVALLSHPGFVDHGDRVMMSERGRALLRFAFELSIDEHESRFFQRPKRAMNGIRASLWDSSQPVAANAMAILLAVEALDGLFAEPPARPLSNVPDAVEPTEP